MSHIPMPPDVDELQTFKEREAKRVLTGPLKACPFCGSYASSQEIAGETFGCRIYCAEAAGVSCGISTPSCSRLDICEILWNRRPKRSRKTQPLVDKPAATRHTATSNRRSTARSQAAGSQVNRPKRMTKPKESQ
jgi:hypothetical protein